jgi:methylmalonyl-CoA mutase cobalamin-binding subunit
LFARTDSCKSPPLPPADANPPPAAGIGLATAQALGKEGAKVVVADIDADAVRQAATQLQAEGVEACSIACDVGDKAQVHAAVAEAVGRYGGLDIAVANAGIVRSADFLDMSETDFDAVLRVNLKGTFLVRGVSPGQGLFDLVCARFGAQQHAAECCLGLFWTKHSGPQGCVLLHCLSCRRGKRQQSRWLRRGVAA